VVELPQVDLKDRPEAQMQTISPDYFRTFGIPLRRGRVFNDRDRTESGATSLIVNESLARLFWPVFPHGQDPVGQHLLIGNGKLGRQIVGIVADVHERGLDIDAMPELYLPLADNALQTAALAVRTQGDPHRFVNSVRAQVLAIDRDQAITNVKTMEEMIDESVGQRRLTLVLLGSFAAVALLLAIVGIYGAIAYSVAQRTQEVAIRRALGAQQSDILKLMLRQGLGWTMAGVAIGTGGAFALTRVMHAMLFHVSATDPATLAGIALLFVLVASAAGYIPARRATQIDPLAAFRVG
jgi:predicted permease